jgi:hypothetical protein
MDGNNSDIEIKKKYICENIEKIKNHTNYIDIVKFHNCPHTNNSNGVFLNLNTINIDVIDKLYFKLRNEIEDDDFNLNIIEKQNIENEIHQLLKYTEKHETKKKYDIINIEEFTQEEQEIIIMSKKYKFD